MCKIKLFVFALFVSNMAAAQTPGEDSIKNEILKLSFEWNQAIIKRDSITLDRILSPEYTLSSSSGSLLPRKDWMENTLHRLFTDSAAFIGPQKITIYGNEAISEGLLHWKVRNDQNKLRNHESLVADIWRYNNGRWQVIHRMSKLVRKR